MGGEKEGEEERGKSRKGREEEEERTGEEGGKRRREKEEKGGKERNELILQELKWPTLWLLEEIFYLICLQLSIFSPSNAVF